jgi:hypothetical protein
MANKANTAWVLVAATAAALAIGVALWLSGGANPDSQAAMPAAPRVPGDTSPDNASSDRDVQLAPTLEIQPVGKSTSTVAWPLKLELELVRAAHLPRAQGLAPLGSGATARLNGRLSAGERAIVGKLTFIGGPNTGRVLECSSSGHFGAVDLYPGLAEVKVTGPGVESIREVNLRANALEQLNITYDFPGSVTGVVFDREAKPLEAVDVELDGQHVFTDERGQFHFATAFGGERVRIVLRKSGYATLTDIVGVATGRPLGVEQFTYTLHPAASLAIQLGPRIGAQGDATVILLPEIQGLNRIYPWHRISPLRMPPGTTYVLDDLPAMRLTVRVFHEGAVANPESETVYLRSGALERHEVRFAPGPSVEGVVVDEQGRRQEGARVVCEAADRLAAVHQYLARTPYETGAEILPPFPMGSGEVRTDFDGVFQLSSWPKLGGRRYLWALSADGKRWGARVIATENPGVIELVVKPVESGQWALSVDFPGRHQGLPVVASIGGAAQPEVLVPAREPLVLRGLAAGTWRIKATWNGKTLLAPEGQEFELDGDLTRTVPLPEGAIAGQDQDTLLRAGRLEQAQPAGS